MKEKEKLTNKESTVLQLLLKSGKPMTASQLTAADDVLNINTVQNVLRTLKKEGFVQISDIVYSGTVLCRSYETTEKARNYSIQKFQEQFTALRNLVPIRTIFTSLLGSDKGDEELLSSLEQIIKNEKESLAEEE